jgi:hypothetical protein
VGVGVRPVSHDRFRVGVDDPHQARTGVQIVKDIIVNDPGFVVRRDHLDGEIGCTGKILLGGRAGQTGSGGIRGQDVARFSRRDGSQVVLFNVSQDQKAEPHRKNIMCVTSGLHFDGNPFHQFEVFGLAK